VGLIQVTVATLLVAVIRHLQMNPREGEGGEEVKGVGKEEQEAIHLVLRFLLAVGVDPKESQKKDLFVPFRDRGPEVQKGKHGIPLVRQIRQ
jgi:hypothetical protein